MRGSSGFSLIETVCALGLLASSLLAAGGLMVTAARQITSAGRVSTALSINDLVLEELVSTSPARAYALLECDTGQPACEVGSGQAAADGWAALAASRLGRAEVRVRLEALDAASLADALAIRVTSSVSWSEGLRDRRVGLVTVRG